MFPLLSEASGAYREVKINEGIIRRSRIYTTGCGRCLQASRGQNYMVVQRLTTYISGFLRCTGVYRSRFYTTLSRPTKLVQHPHCRFL